MLDPERFPSLVAFLESLPHGLDSYPECTAKASMVLNLADDRPPSPEDLAALPPPLRRMSEHRPPVSSWISEVHSHAMMLALFDRGFNDLPEFGAYAYKQGAALLSGRLYAAAFKFVSPSLLIKTAALRWGMFHRGTTCRAVQERDGFVRAHIEFPQGLFGDVILTGFAEGVRAAMDLATGGGATVAFGARQPTRACIDLKWPPKS